MKGMTPADRARLAEHITDLQQYASRYLRIAIKKGGAAVPLQFNAAQLYLHKMLEEQLRSVGKVRALVLKGRQQGISTYYEARQFRNVATNRGRRAYILAHEQDASDNLFGMFSRYYQHLPQALKPILGASNSKEIYFARLDSRISVATAGTKGAGRSATSQYVHGSEVAFWPNAMSHLEGLGQTVADAPGTEVMLETTANGTANPFHDLWQLAIAGRSDYLPIFIPWFWQLEYRREIGEDFELSHEEQEYADAFGLDDEQMAWRRAKTASDFGDQSSRFDQEYPASAELAFAGSNPRALISGLLVAKARRVRGVEGIGPRIMGVDPAEYGDDETSVMLRQGRVAQKLDGWQGAGPMESVARIAVLADAHKPDVICVDATNSAGITDRLAELNYPVVRVHFGEAPTHVEQYVTMRDEMWGEMHKWLQDQPASIPDQNSLAAQLTSVERTYDSRRRMKLESKERMKARGLRSPDDADALATTFYPYGVIGHSAARFKRAQAARPNDWRAR